MAVGAFRSSRHRISNGRFLQRFDRLKSWGLLRHISDQPPPSITHTPKHSFGIAFDIDGVLLRGSQPIGGAPQALRQLYNDVKTPTHTRIPFVFLTNGGGVPESMKASELSRLLGVRISPHQVLLGHTPFNSLVDRFQNAQILAVGKGEPASVMVEYGYRNVVSLDDYVLQFEDIDPLAKYKHWSRLQEACKERGVRTKHMGQKQIDAVFIVSDPVDWGRDIQVLCDVLRSGGLPGRRFGQQPPIFFAADDFEYQAAFPVERLGMGAFRIAFENIYNRIGGTSLIYTSFGKPKTAVFRSAELALQRIAGMLASQSSLETFMYAGKNDMDFSANIQNSQFELAKLDTIYMIGDNPATDIFGARQAGRPWFSILTRTGCFKGNGNDPLYPADMVVENMEEAMRFILMKHDIERLPEH